MMKLRIGILLFATWFLWSCGSKKVVQKTPEVEIAEPVPEDLPSVKQLKHIKKLKKDNPALNKDILKYIRKYAPISVREMHEYKIPASITLAQGILESGSGKSTLASKSNNHFGIKCHKGWTGERVYHDDDAKGECFRKYKYVESSYEDHSLFLSERRRYAFLFTLGRRDYKAWARGLKRAGYATDKRYPQKLIKLIKDYKLYEFDRIKKDWRIEEIRDEDTITVDTDTIEPVEPKVIPQEPKTKTGNYYEVRKGDTLYSIARWFNTTVEKLKELNGLKDNVISIGQRLRVK